jgi:hypothetical protein
MSNRIQLGVVAIRKDKMKAHPGSYHSAGAKVYKSEPMARVAINNSHNADDYLFLPAYAEIEPEPIHRHLFAKCMVGHYYSSEYKNCPVCASGFIPTNKYVVNMCPKCNHPKPCNWVTFPNPCNCGG